MAKWRRRTYRGLVAALLTGVAATSWLVYQTTSSAAVRQQVIAQLRQRFVGAEVALGSATLQLLGGITFSNLTLYRRDDPSQTPFLHVPAGVIYHDKQQLGRGRLVIRKIKCERPRLTVVRSGDGRWNLSGILGPVRPDVPIPVFEIVQGAVVLNLADDSAGRFMPRHLEVRDVNGTMLNHPLPVLNFDLRGALPSFGPLALQGSWLRVEQQLLAALDIAPVSLGPVVLRELGRMVPGFADGAEQIGGDGRFQLNLAYRADATPSWRHSIRAEVQNGRLVHRALPFPIENLNAVVRCDDGQVAIESFSANAGPAKVAAKARLDAHLPSAPGRIDATVFQRFPPPEVLQGPWLNSIRSLEFTLSGLPVTPELFDRLPAGLVQYRQRFAPVGPVDITGKIERSAEAWSASMALAPRDLNFRFEAFPYPLHGVRGFVQWRLSSHAPAQLDVDLTASGNENRPVTIRGRVQGSGLDAAYHYNLSGDGLPLDERLIQSLPVKFQNITRSFHPTGRCDITAAIRRQPGQAAPVQDYRVRIRDGAVCYDVFPAPLTRVTGLLDIHLAPPGDKDVTRFQFTDFRGERGDGRITVSGSAQPLTAGHRIDLAIRGEQMPLDAALAGAFGRMRLRPLWDMLAPSGRMDFDATLAHVESPGAPPEFTLRVAPQGATVRPAFFPYTLHDLSGVFSVTRMRVDVQNLHARHGASVLRMNGGSIAFRDGGYWADLAGIVGEPLPVDVDLVRACPAALRSVCQALDPRGALAVNLDRLIIHQPPQLPGPGGPPTYYWKGRVGFTDAAFRAGVQWDGVTGVVACTGRSRGYGIEQVEGHVAIERASVLRQPITDLHARAFIDPKASHELRIENVHGKLYGGQIGGEACIVFGAGLQYRVDIKAVGVALDEFARHNRLGSAQLSGAARAELYLAGAGVGADELEGRATVHVPEGKLYNLPVFLDMLKVLGLRSPDGAAFEEAHVELAIHGKRAEVERIDLIGNAISLGGQGSLNLDGTDLRLDLYAVWGHIVQLLPAGLREVPPWFSKNLMKITARGQLGGKIDTAVEPAPGIVEPVKQWMERLHKAREAMVRQPLPFTPRLKGN